MQQSIFVMTPHGADLTFSDEDLDEDPDEEPEQKKSNRILGLASPWEILFGSLLGIGTPDLKLIYC